MSRLLLVCLIAYRVCFCEHAQVIQTPLGANEMVTGESREVVVEETNLTFYSDELKSPSTQVKEKNCFRCKRSNVDCISTHNQASSCSSKETRCQKERRRAMEKSMKGDLTYLHVPSCRTDGGFQEIQCHDMMGYCWCVNEEGKPLPRTSAFGRNKTRCEGSKNSQNAINVKKRRGLKLKGCQEKKKNDFNFNLINLFREELLRDQGSPQVNSHLSNSSKLINNTSPRLVAEWKFKELDKDRDTSLSNHEIQTLKAIVKKIVKPTLCANDFPVVCDKNEDEHIALEEWMECLQYEEVTNISKKGRKIEHRPKFEGRFPISLHSWPSDASRKKKSSQRSRDNSGEPSILDLMIRTGEYQKLSMHKDKRGKNKKQKSGDKGKHTKEQPRRRSNHQEESSQDLLQSGDCFTERQKATQLDKDNPRGHIYVPDCDPVSGLYMRAQCHTSTRYCWCVDPKTGIAIPGVATQNITPNCEEIELLARTMPGCQLNSKKKLLVELLDIITQQMADDSSMKSPDEPDPSQSLEEQAVRWKFKVLDSNNDSILSKTEIKAFRNEIKRALTKSEKLMHYCGRKFTNFCDADQDENISLKEWIDCFGLSELSKISSSPSKRSGKNPFTTMLT